MDLSAVPLEYRKLISEHGTVADFRSRGWAELPDWLGNLTNLTELSLSYNQLTQLPDWLGNLTNLTELNLGYNELTQLPHWLGNLTNLTELDLSQNELTQLPDSLWQPHQPHKPGPAQEPAHRIAASSL